MISDFLKQHITSGAAAPTGMVEYGYAQVEPNHLSAQRTGQIYAQLPAEKDITVLENGQFVVYDYGYRENGEADSGFGRVRLPGKNTDLEPMLVFNEIKLYREGQLDCEFAMVKDNYNARIYSPLDPDTLNWTRQSRYYNSTNFVAVPGEYVEAEGITEFATGKDYYIKDGDIYTKNTAAFDANTTYYTYEGEVSYPMDDVTAAPDMYEIHYNEEPWHIEGRTKEKRMPEGTKMVPRVFKTNVGDHYTTNAVKAAFDNVAVGATLIVGSDGFLTPGSGNGMVWQVVKKYTLPDRQKAVKVLRIK